MRRILFVVLFLAFFTPSVYGAVTDVSISPSNPEQGDVIVIGIQANPNEEVEVSLDYSGDAPVSGGEYEIILYDVLIPNKPNSFSARVSGVENLKIGVKYGSLPWVTLQKEADDGVATISQSNIPTGAYNIKVRGDALSGETNVDLSFSADITLIMDDDGTYSYSYDTEDIPPGTIKVNVGGEKQTITLSADSGGSSSGGVTVPTSPTAAFSINGERLVGEVLSFDASISDPVVGTITKYSWSFGDGSTGGSSTVTHVYSEAGEYAVQLTVTNTYGLTDEKTYSLIIDEVPNLSPVVTGGSDRSCLSGQVLVFKTQSSDSDGVIVDYLWSFGDGVTGEGKSVQHSWETPGVYAVNHTVVDDRGASASTYYVVNVETLNVGLEFEKEILLETRLFQYFSDLGASITASGNNTVLYFFKYDGNPSNSSLPNGQIGSILDLVVSDPDSILWPIHVEVDYPRDSVDNVTETSLGLYYYQGGVWGRCLRTGVDPSRGIVWANLTRSELTGSPLTVGVVEPLPYFITSGFRLLTPVVEEGEMVSAQYNVSNIGDKSGNVVTLIYLDDTPVASRNTHLLSGESNQVTVGFNSPSRGSYSVVLGEYSDTLTVSPPTVPDLHCTVAANQTTVSIGENVLFTYTVFNQGNRTAEDFTCSLEINGLKVSSTRIESLGANGSRSMSYAWSSSTVGLYTAAFSVDLDDIVSETDETNNQVLIDVEVERSYPYLYWVLLIIAAGGVFVYYYRKSRAKATP